MFTPSLWPPWVMNLGWTVAILVAAYAVGHLVRALVAVPLRIVARRMAVDRNGVVVREVKRRIPFWSLLIGVALAVDYWPLSAGTQAAIVRAVWVVVTISVTLAASAVAVELVGKFGPRATPLAPVSGLAQDIVRIVVLTIGFGAVVRSLGYDLTPYLAALGVGGLAVALALQDPLSNLFAGVSITLSGQVHIGDYVKTDSGVEGYVTDFDWRATTVRMRSGSSVIFPNSKLAQSVVTNFYQPSRQLTVPVDVAVDYASNPDDVERVAVDVAREVMQTVSGGVKDFEPFVRFHTFGPTMTCTVTMSGREFADQFLIKHEFVKRLHDRFVREGIVVPGPKTVLDVKTPIHVRMVAPSDRPST